ncbi:hypothetical protein HPP92_013853 [Vanilla planifolia]|uniref:Uncharacterized protein n=1 Tax=Vanilla planifolia TaxID=51239 RepID=A0A835QUT5_VANPL|nr:hypothetical protein HPP92_013853 [Vanilla planifolia]
MWDKNGTARCQSAREKALFRRLRRKLVKDATSKLLENQSQNKSLSFGKEYPGFVNPLDGWKEPAVSGYTSTSLKVINNLHQLRGQRFSNQFSVTEHYRDGKVIFTERTNHSFIS